MEFKMLSDAMIILANMRGGYVNVGSTVHTLFRMSDRPRKEIKEAHGGPSSVPAATAFDTVQPSAPD
jgi:hypothetical protein